jgi:riboflavin kinase/FMN adenylyltransferase
VSLQKLQPPKYLALGVFDGLHLGHQKLIRECVTQARAAGAISVVFTFPNHPLDILAPAYAPKRLMLLSEKLNYLGNLGVDVTICIEFDRDFARLEPEQFVRRILVERCATSKLFCGYNFRFGRNASGTVKIVRHLARKYGFSLHVHPRVYSNGMTVSSSKIRELIDDGMVDLAARLLTRPYQLRARVIAGKGRGAELGYPTANLRIPSQLLIPAEGVYAVTVERSRVKKASGKKAHRAMLYIGKCPTFGSKRLSIEVHLFDFCGKLTDETLQVAFLKRLRGEKRFHSPDALAAQLRKDERAARSVLHEIQ